MTDDSKEWVTIKIPKAERDDARDDPRTYGEIMRAGLDGEPKPETSGPFPDVSELEADAVPEEVKERLERIESSTATVEERTGQIQRDIEGLGR